MANAPESPTAKLELELRRGALVLAVLTQLRQEQYGYSLRQALAERGMPIEEGTLYPLLRRLEGQGLLASEWKIENGPPRRYETTYRAGTARSICHARDYLDGLAFKSETNKRRQL